VHFIENEFQAKGNVFVLFWFLHGVLCVLQRYLNVLHDLTRLRDHYYSVYLEKLEKKVSDQRKAFAAREEKIQRKILRENKKKVTVSFPKDVISCVFQMFWKRYALNTVP